MASELLGHPDGNEFDGAIDRTEPVRCIGQTVSGIGSWAQSLAVTWLVLELTDRSDQLGIALALQFRTIQDLRRRPHSDDDALANSTSALASRETTISLTT